jgi:hypothetical protein
MGGGILANRGFLIAVAMSLIMGNAVFAESWILGRELSFAITAVLFLLVLKYCKRDDLDREDDDDDDNKKGKGKKGKKDDDDDNKKGKGKKGEKKSGGKSDRLWAAWVCPEGYRWSGKRDVGRECVNSSGKETGTVLKETEPGSKLSPDSDYCSKLDENDKKKLAKKMAKNCRLGLTVNQVKAKYAPKMECPELAELLDQACAEGNTLSEETRQRTDRCAKPCPSEYLSRNKPCLSDDGTKCCNKKMENCVDRFTSAYKNRFQSNIPKGVSSSNDPKLAGAPVSSAKPSPPPPDSERPPGAYCTSYKQCASGGCKNNRCRDPSEYRVNSELPPGAYCTSYKQCASGGCKNNRCTDPSQYYVPAASPSATPPPARHALQLFAQSAFSGEPKNFGYDKSICDDEKKEISKLGINRDDLSSVVVGPGVSVILYERLGGLFGGEDKLGLQEGRHDLDSMGWNDKTDYIKVHCKDV